MTTRNIFTVTLVDMTRRKMLKIILNKEMWTANLEIFEGLFGEEKKKRN